MANLMAQMAGLAALAVKRLGRVWGIRRLRARRRAAPGRPAGDTAASTAPAAPAAAPDRVYDALLFSHEMRNYLCALRGNAHLLRLKTKSPDQAAILDRIDKAIERLEGFACRGQEVPSVVAPCIREWIDPVQAARASSLTHVESGRAEFSFNASEGLPYIQGDPHRLEQVFLNLYGNALEAGADRVRILFRRLGNELEIAVEDNGRGCRPEVVARIFERCFTTKAVPPGEDAARSAAAVGQVGSGPAGAPSRGLGLFIVRAIVESHGGRIRATTKNGRGDGETGLVVHMHFPAPAARDARTAPRPERLPIAA